MLIPHFSMETCVLMGHLINIWFLKPNFMKYENQILVWKVILLSCTLSRLHFLCQGYPFGSSLPIKKIGCSGGGGDGLWWTAKSIFVCTTPNSNPSIPICRWFTSILTIVVAVEGKEKFEGAKVVQSIAAVAQSIVTTTIEAKPISGHGGLDAVVEEKSKGAKSVTAPHRSIVADTTIT